MFDFIYKKKEEGKYSKTYICGICFTQKIKYSEIYKQVKKNYDKVIKRLKDEVKQRPLRVMFLVSEKQKWGCQSLYEGLLADKYFEPVIAVSCVLDKNGQLKTERPSVEENATFFRERGMNVVEVCDNNGYSDISKYNPDIIFYQQPWNIPDIHHPIKMSKTALCCYCSYSIAGAKTASMKKQDFFYSLWKYFLVHDCMKEEFSEWMKYNLESLVVTGHPKLDVYMNYTSSDYKASKHYVIYAPHFSVGKSILGFSTFDWSGQFMLEYARKHPEINWVFKPHPRLKGHFQEQNYMTKEEIDNYYDEWAQVALVYDEGDYFDIFKNSDAMITDCGSFCTEYFFTGKPLLHLISENSKQHSALNRLVNANHYSISNRETLEKYLDEVVINKNDFLKDVRSKALNDIFQNKLDSASNVINHIKKELEI